MIVNYSFLKILKFSTDKQNSWKLYFHRGFKMEHFTRFFKRQISSIQGQNEADFGWDAV